MLHSASFLNVNLFLTFSVYCLATQIINCLSHQEIETHDDVDKDYRYAKHN